MNGSRFGKYRLVELLGRGGMGEVWRAHDTVIDRMVAVKILPADISKDDLFQQRFRREVHATARLNSPHIIPIHTHGEINGRLFVDMRLVEGRDLQTLLNAGPVSPRRSVHIIDQIAKALHTAHKAGLVHRDVKPSNILLDDDDFAYLIDFGIARAADELSLTAAGEVVGTLHYMAPERFGPDADLVNARSDIYSLTCVLFECLTARHPFPGNSMEQQITNHLVTPPPRPSSFNAGLPRGFDTVIATGMAKNPNDRYPTTLALARAAQHAVDMPADAPQAAAAARAATQQVPIGRRPSIGGSTPRPAPSGPQVAPPAAAHGTAPVTPVQPWWRQKSAIIAGAAVLIVAAVVAGVSVAVSHHGSEPKNPRQGTLPFTGLRTPQGVSIDNAGTVYVADTLHDKVLALTAGSTTPAVLPFSGLHYPTGVTADSTGTVYVTDAGNKRVVVLRAGSDTQTVLPFTGLGNPTGITVDTSRTVYVIDTENNQVVALDAHSNQQTVLPFSGLDAPTGVVVNGTGTIYVADGGNNQVLALSGGSSAPTVVPFSGLNEPGGVTVDSQGAVYVTDSGNNRTLKIPVGATTQEELPFTGLDYPWGLAVDNLGTVYVADHSNRVIYLRQ